MTLKLVIPVIVLALFVSSCKNEGVSPSVQTPSPVILEVEYVNFAWGFIFHGYRIDGNANIRLYDFSGSPDTFHVNSAGTYTESELLHKFGHHDSLVLSVPRDTLLKYFASAESVRTDAYSDTTRVGADMGSISYFAYRYSEAKSKYEQVVLRREGDWILYNKSGDAIKLVEWMKSVNPMH